MHLYETFLQGKFSKVPFSYMNANDKHKNKPNKQTNKPPVGA